MFKKISFISSNPFFLGFLVTLFILVQTSFSAWAVASFQQYTQAVGLYRSGQYIQAYQQFSGLMQAHPEDVRLPYYMALTAVRLGKVGQAKRYYETVLTIAPKSLVAPYAKQGLGLLLEAQKLDEPPNPATAVKASQASMPTTTAGTAKRNTLVAQWQKTHPVTGVTLPAIASPSKSEAKASSAPQLPVATEPSTVVSTTMPPIVTPIANSKEIGISPAMLAVSATGSAGVASSAQATPTPPSTNLTAEQLQLQQQQQNQQMMQTMMMMQMMGGSGGGSNGGGGGNNANPMAMMLPMMMMQQQQQQQSPTAGGNVPGNPFSGIDPKMMSDMMTQGMMNNLDLFSDSKKDN